MDIEYKILQDIFTRNTFQEQANLLVELNNQDFKTPENFDVFKVFNAILIKRQKIDAVSFYEMDRELSKRNLKLNESDYVPESEVLNRIRQLKERNYRNEVRQKVQNWVADLNKENDTDKFDEIKNGMIVGLSQTDLDTGSKFINPIEYTAKIDENLAKDAGMEGYSWGLTDLDAYTSGIVLPRMIVVGGLKKTGKSRFIINTRHHLYKQKVPSVFLSLEMPGYEVTKLTYSRHTGIPDSHFKANSFMLREEKEAYERAKRELDWNLMPIECANSLTINQVLHRIRLYAKIYKNPVIFLDYLQRIKHDRNKQAQELEFISNALADATRTYNVTLVILVQLSNLAEREQVSIGHIKGSGGVAESADCILLLDNIYRRTKQDSDRGKFEVTVEQRYGDSGRFKVTADLGTSTYGDFIESLPEPRADYYKNSVDFP